jgi:hypothetical protein
MERMETTTNAPAQTAVSDALTVALAAGHALDSLAVHAAQLGLTKLEKPMTTAEAAAAAAEDGFLTVVVKVSLYALQECRVNEEAGEDYPVARFDLREALRLSYDPEELDEMFGTTD